MAGDFIDCEADLAFEGTRYQGIRFPDGTEVFLSDWEEHLLGTKTYSVDPDGDTVEIHATTLRVGRNVEDYYQTYSYNTKAMDKHRQQFAEWCRVIDKYDGLHGYDEDDPRRPMPPMPPPAVIVDLPDLIGREMWEEAR